MYEEVKTCCIYARYSSDKQTEQSIEGQLTVCEDFCKRHNIKVVKVYIDRATSASKNIEKRVQFLEMIKDSEKHPFDAVVVYKIDRFSRSRYDTATFKYRLKRNGVIVMSATENISDAPEGIILESLLEGLAEYYSAELSQKVKRGMAESAKKKNSTGGCIPWGYKIVDKKYVIDEPTAKLVRKAFEMYADGEKISHICLYFNERGYRTSKNARFTRSSFNAVFKNEKYMGTYVYDGYKAENGIPAIIDRDLWDRAQARYTASRKGKRERREDTMYKFLLTGKIFCGECGSTMWGNKNNGIPYYRCSLRSNGGDCNKSMVRVKWIEDLVIDDIMNFFDDTTIEKIADIAIAENDRLNGGNEKIPVYADRLKEIDSSLLNLLKAIESGTVPETIATRMKELEKERRDLSKKLEEEEADTIILLNRDMVVYWLSQFKDGDRDDLMFRKRLIDMLVSSVTIWNERDGLTDVKIAYNLSENNKTYRIPKNGNPPYGFTSEWMYIETETHMPILVHHISAITTKRRSG